MRRLIVACALLVCFVPAAAFAQNQESRPMADNYGPSSDPVAAAPLEEEDIKDGEVKGPKLGDGNVVALLTLSSTGKIRTAASGQRVELVATSSIDMLKFWANATATDGPGRIYAEGSAGSPNLRISSPNTTTKTYPAEFIGTPASTHEAANWVMIAGVLMPHNDAMSNLGAVGYAFDKVVAYEIDDESGNTVIDTSKYTSGTWTPAISAVTTDPTNIVVNSGNYVRHGNLVNAWANVTADDDPAFTPGSGIYYWTLPVTAHADHTSTTGSGNGDNIGTVQFWDSSTGDYYQGTCHLRGTGTFYCVFHGSAGRQTGAANPVAPAAGDRWTFQLTYMPS